MIIGKNIDLRPIELSDAEFILSLRLDPELSQYLSPVENNLDKQRQWLKTCQEDPTQHYFIIQNKQQQPVGTIRIYDIKNNSFCWGSWIVIPEARSYTSYESIILLYQYAFFDLGLDITHFDVRKENTKALNFYLRFGAVITHEDNQDFFLVYTKGDFVDTYSDFNTAIDKTST